MPIPQPVDLEMRGGDHPDSEMNALEKLIAEEAFNRVNSQAPWTELGYRRAYNFLHLLNFYMTRDPYKLKLLHRLDPMPSYVEMEMTQGICPLSCVFCENTYWDEKPIQLLFDRFKYAMDQFPELKWAGNNALGDPFTNPDCWRIWDYLDRKDVIQELYLTSYLLSPPDMRKFVDMRGLVFLKFSFDAATKDTYESLRVGSDFDKVLKNIVAFDKAKRNAGRYWPELHFHYIVMKDNIHEAISFLELIDSLGINCSNVMYSRLLWNFKEVEHLYTEIPQSLCQELQRKGKELNIPVSWNADLPGSKPPINECTTWLMPYIFPDGTVIPCCNFNEGNRRPWQRENSMGNIFQQSMREIWYGPKYTQLKRMLWAKKPMEASPMCQICNIYDPKKLSEVGSI